MPITVGNIITGSANFFEGDTSSIRDVGATVGGVTLAMGSHDFVRVEIDQLRGVAALEQIMKSFLVRTSLAEPTLANLEMAFSQEAGTLSGAVLSVEDVPRRTRRCVFVGPAPGTNKYRSFSADNCVFVGTPEQTYQRGSNTQVPIELEIIPQARTWAQSLRAGASVASDGVSINSVIGDLLVAADKLIGGILSVVSGTGTGQSRAVTDNTIVTSGAPGTGSLTVNPSFTTTPASGDWVYVTNNRAAQWGTIRDV